MSEQKPEERSTQTNVNEFIGELNAGILVEQIGIALSAAALATIINGLGKKAKVSLDFTLTQIGENDQVVITTKLSTAMPTKRGKKSEENSADTPMFVGKGGRMTIDAPQESLTGQFNLQQEVELPGKVTHVNVRSISAT